MYKQSFSQILRFFLVIGSIISIYLIFKYTILVIYPFLFAIAISFTINPLVTFLETKGKLPRGLITFIVMLIVLILIVGSSFLIIAELIQGTTYLAEKAPVHFQAFMTFVENLLNTKILPLYQKLISSIHMLSPLQQTTINENIQHFTTNIASTGAVVIQNILLKIPAFLSLLPNSISMFLFTIVATFLITKDWYELKKVIKKVIPSAANKSTQSVLTHLKSSLIGFFKAQLILVSITFCLIFIGLSFFKVEHALTIALIAAATDLLPYIGTGVIFLPWIVYLFVTGNYILTINLSILYIIIIIIRQVIEPKILSANIGLNPLTALITLFIGIQLWGVLGIIIAPILLILLSAFYQAGIALRLWKFVKG